MKSGPTQTDTTKILIIEDLPVTSFPKISLIIPVFNEAESLESLFKEIQATLLSLPNSYEVIFSDDGSQDGTEKVLESLCRRFPKEVRAVTLRKRGGKAGAIAAGLSIAEGEWILTMDGDGQDVPSEIPKFLKKLNQGYDMACGWRKKRFDSLSKRLPSKLFNWATRLVSGLPLRDFNCGFKIYRKSVLDSIVLYGGLYRYLSVLVHQQGYRIAEIPIIHRPRRTGRSKYGSSRFIQGFLDLLTVTFIIHFLSRPLHFFGCVGFGMAGIGVMIDGYLSWMWFLGQTIGNRPLLLFGNLLVILGIQVVLMGLIGEMLTRFFHPKESHYFIKHVLRLDGDQQSPLGSHPSRPERSSEISPN